MLHILGNSGNSAGWDKPVLHTHGPSQYMHWTQILYYVNNDFSSQDYLTEVMAFERV